MKKFINVGFLSLLLANFVFVGCKTKEEYPFTTYVGTVVEENSLNQLSDIQVTISDGTKTISETVTDSAGQFSMDLDQNSRSRALFLLIDGNGVFPSTKVDLFPTEDPVYDCGLIYLYNQTDASLYPTINDFSWDYPYGDQSIRFKDIVINSDYPLTSAYVELAAQDDFLESRKCQLSKQGDGAYSVLVDGISVGDMFYFRVVASNTIGTKKSEVYSKTFGYPLPKIINLKNATVDSATILMNVSDDPLSTTSAGLCWSTSHNPTINDSKKNSSSTTGTSSVSISGLDFSSKSYYVRAYAQNANGIAYSEELAMPVNNPYNLPTFSSRGATYTYMYIGMGTWSEAKNNCLSHVYVFDGWTLPSIDVLPDFYNAYSRTHGEPPQLPLWSKRKYDDQEDGESETYMLTRFGESMESKSMLANYYAIRRID